MRTYHLCAVCIACILTSIGCDDNPCKCPGPNSVSASAVLIALESNKPALSFNGSCDLTNQSICFSYSSYHHQYSSQTLCHMRNGSFSENIDCPEENRIGTCIFTETNTKLQQRLYYYQTNTIWTTDTMQADCESRQGTWQN